MDPSLYQSFSVFMQKHPEDHLLISQLKTYNLSSPGDRLSATIPYQSIQYNATPRNTIVQTNVRMFPLPGLNSEITNEKSNPKYNLLKENSSGIRVKTTTTTLLITCENDNIHPSVLSCYSVRQLWMAPLPAVLPSVGLA